MKIRNVAGAVTAAGMQGRAGKAYNFLEKGVDELEVNMYGEVVETVPVDWRTGKPVEGLYICEKDFLGELEKYRTKSRITLRINSVGGDLYAGMAIANRLKELDAEITTIADALCASAAVAIFLSGKTRKVFRGSQVMIHEPSCVVYGRYDRQRLDKLVKGLEAGRKAVVNEYADRTGRTVGDLEKMLEQECWMTGQEAIDEGFANELAEGEGTVGITEDKKEIISNGVSFPVEAFASLPKMLRVLKNGAGICRGLQSGIDIGKGGEERMTVQELKEKYPDVYDQVAREASGGRDAAVSDAVEAERKRIREIDEIANQVGDAKLVEDAKFGEKPMNAAELALEALRKQGQIGEKFLKEYKEDSENSMAADVVPSPNAGTKTQEEQSLQDIMDGAALIAGISGKGKE